MVYMVRDECSECLDRPEPAQMTDYSTADKNRWTTEVVGPRSLVHPTGMRQPAFAA
jgi:hypothetical protein